MRFVFLFRERLDLVMEVYILGGEFCVRRSGVDEGEIFVFVLGYFVIGRVIWFELVVLGDLKGFFCFFSMGRVLVKGLIF